MFSYHLYREHVTKILKRSREQTKISEKGAEEKLNGSKDGKFKGAGSREQRAKM